MDGKRFITKLRLRNLLSFGPDAEEFELEPLNVLIGPNASGKSNVIEAISLLQAAPDDIQEPISAGGGVGEWLWKGRTEPPFASIDASILHWGRETDLRYRLAFRRLGQSFQIIDETVEAEVGCADTPVPDAFYSFNYGEPTASIPVSGPEGLDMTDLAWNRIERTTRDEQGITFAQSVLAQRKAPRQYPEITYLGANLERIRIYNNWDLSREGDLRHAQLPDLESDFLREDAKNLTLVINDLQNRPALDERLNEELRRFYPRAKKITVRILGGTVQLQLHEEGLRDPIPATRLSDGTLRYLCLLSILLHPDPPPLVCIEEPEIGLHPDIVVRLAQLMVEASERMQLIVTTHSDALVAALSSVPEAVAICERDENGSTAIRRLSRDDIGEWLDRYTLGDLWMMGELGGVL